MGIRNIYKFGEDALRKKCREVTKFDSRLWALLDDMYDTMSQYSGVGLAAPQVGILKRAVVIDISGELKNPRKGFKKSPINHYGRIELINPVIISSEGVQRGEEGCLSNPNKYGIVERPKLVTVKAQDRNGNEFTISGEDLLARAFCHEIDHLDGILYIDREVSNDS
ncbi:MAG: peptide deformylase [Oscillospiraceae bacterium]